MTEEMPYQGKKGKKKINKKKSAETGTFPDRIRSPSTQQLWEFGNKQHLHFEKPCFYCCLNLSKRIANQKTNRFGSERLENNIHIINNIKMRHTHTHARAHACKKSSHKIPAEKNNTNQAINLLCRTTNDDSEIISANLRRMKHA